MTEYTICNFCGERNSKWKCLDCKNKQYLCEDCFIVQHKSEKFKNHKKEEFKKENIDCSDHKGSKIEFICKKCTIPLCIQCKEGKLHQNHETLNFQNEQSQKKDYIKNELKKNQNLLTKIEETAHKEKKTKKEAYKSLSLLKKEVNEFFTKVFNLFIIKRSEILKKIWIYEMMYNQADLTLLSKQKLAKKQVQRKGNLLNKLNLKNFTDIKTWKEVDSEASKFGDISRKSKEIEITSGILATTIQNLMKISTEKFIPKDQIMKEMLKDQFKNIINLNFGLDFLLPQEISNVDKTNPNRKIIKFSENP